MRMGTKSILVGLLTPAATAAAAQAALVISTGSAAPTEGLVASQPNSNAACSDSFRVRPDGTGRDLGQMFTVGSDDVLMDAFTLRVLAVSNIVGRAVSV